MNQTLTLSLIALAAALGVLFGWMGARPPNPLKGPRLLPYRALMMLCAAVLMMLATHLAGILGIVKK